MMAQKSRGSKTEEETQKGRNIFHNKTVKEERELGNGCKEKELS